MTFTAEMRTYQAKSLLVFLLLPLLNGAVNMGCHNNVRQCFKRPALDSVAKDLLGDTYRFAFTSQQLPDICRDWGYAKYPCYKAKMYYCNDENRPEYEGIRNVLEYVCGGGKDRYVKQSSCFTTDAVKNQMQSCDDRVGPQLNATIKRHEKGEIDVNEFRKELCRLTTELTECWWKVVEKDCGIDAMKVYKKLTIEFLKPFLLGMMCYWAEGCKLSRLGKMYQGKGSQTYTGLTCQRWDSQQPHKHPHTNADVFPDESVADAANYCRNPDEHTGPWCYTTDPDTPWEYCAVRQCEKKKPAKPLSTGTIVGIVAGSLTVLAALCSGCVCCCKYCCTEDEPAPEPQEGHPMNGMDQGLDNTDGGKAETTWSKPEDYKSATTDYGETNKV